jgi:hypothetical protein
MCICSLQVDKKALLLNSLCKAKEISMWHQTQAAPVQALALELAPAPVQGPEQG